MLSLAVQPHPERSGLRGVARAVQRGRRHRCGSRRGGGDRGGDLDVRRRVRRRPAGTGLAGPPRRSALGAGTRLGCSGPCQWSAVRRREGDGGRHDRPRHRRESDRWLVSFSTAHRNGLPGWRAAAAGRGPLRPRCRACAGPGSSGRRAALSAGGAAGRRFRKSREISHTWRARCLLTSTPSDGWTLIGGRPRLTAGAAVWQLPDGEFRYGEMTIRAFDLDVPPAW